MTYIQQFDLILRHKPGKLIIIADTLLRQSRCDIGSNDNQNVTILLDLMFTRHIIHLYYLQQDEIKL